MVRVRQLFVVAGIMFCAPSPSITPAHGQTDHPVIAAEAAFHRAEMLETLAKQMPPAVNAKRWLEAFLGNDKKTVVHALTIASLFTDYTKLGKANKTKTIQLIEAIAAELIASGDGDMFMRLASRYVNHNTDVVFTSRFAGQRKSFGKTIDQLGAIIRKTMAQMPPDDQRTFKRSLANAIAHTLVNNCNDDGTAPVCNSRPDLPLAVMGYRLLIDFAQGTGVDAAGSSEGALWVMRHHLAKHNFKPEDMDGLLTRDGIADFEKVTKGYVPPSQSPLMVLFEMGIRADRDAGESIRRVFISYLTEDAGAEFGVMVYTRTYDIAERQHQARLNYTIAQQIISRDWQVALGKQFKLDELKTIYRAHYISPTPGTRYLFAAAKTKQLSAQEQAQMPALFADLLKRTAARPEAYYRLMDDFIDNAQYSKALLEFQPMLKAAQVAAQFDFLANIYISSTDFVQTSKSLMRLERLIRTNMEGSVTNRMTTKAFRATILKYAPLARNNSEAGYQLAKLVQSANNRGWHALIDKEFIDDLKERFKQSSHTGIIETLSSIIEVNDMRRRMDADERARLKEWAPTVRRANPK